MSPPPPVWSEPFRVRSYEIAPDARLALPPLCDWLQEAAGNHATALGVATDRLLENGRAWVLTRLQVAVARYPGWREEVTLETWPSAADGLYAQRDFLLTDDAGKTVARATSQWLVIDVARRRPLRLPPEVTAVLPRPDRPHALAPSREPIPEPGSPTTSRRFTVRRSDLDLNHHVNNVRYVEWGLEAAPENGSDRRCARLDVQFRAESVYGDTVESVSAPEGGGEGLLHRVSHADDGRVLALLRTAWV